jgi:hypothetical protein
VLLGSDVALSTGAAGGNLDFAGTAILNGDQLLTLSAGTGSVTFGAAVGNTTALSGLDINSASQVDFDSTLAVDDQGIDIDAGIVNFDSTVTTSNSGGMTVTNTGTLTSLGSFNLDGGFSQDGNGVVSLGGNITTTADNINFDAGLILTTNVAMSTGGTAGNIDFDSSINGGTNSLSLNSGTAGTIDVAGQLTNVGSLTIANSNGATFRDDVSVSTVTITDTTDGATVAFQDNLTAGSLVTSAEGYGVSLLGATTTITADTSFNNTGTTVIGDQASDIIQFINGLDATSAGGVSIAGTVRTTGENIDLGGTTITQAARLDTTNNGADVNGASITTGAVTATSDALTLNAGNAGSVSVGSIAGVSNLELVQSGGATFRGDVTATSVVLTDTTDGATIQFDGSLNATALTTTTGNGYNLTFNGPSTTINNALIFSNSGVLTFGNEAGDDILFNGGATTDPAATVNVFGSVRTTGDILNLGNVNVVGASSLQTVGANLILSGITSTGNQALDVSSGAITVSGAVDDVALTIKDSGGATFQGQVGVNSPVSLIVENTTAGQDITFLAETALTNLTTAAQGYGLSFTGSTNNFTNLVELNNTGGIVFGNGADAFTFNGGVRNNSVSTISLSGSILSNDAEISLGNVDLSPGQQSVVASTLTPGASASSGADITFGAVDGGSSILRVDAGTGGNSVLFTGSTDLSQFLTESNNYGVSFFGSDNSIANATIFNNSGALRFGNAASDSIEFTAGVTVNSATTVNGTVSTTGSALALQQLIVGEGGTARIETSGGAVSVSGLVNGEPGATPENLIIEAGDVTFGAGVELNDVNITGGDVAFNQGADLTGTLTVSATNFNVAGAVLEVDGGLAATGNVTLGQNVVSQNAGVSITGALTLSEDADVTVSTANGDLTVTGNVSGTSGANNETLTINTGTGRVSLQDVFGAGTSDNAGGLTDVTLVNTGTFSVEQIAITGALTQQNAATGATTLNDVVNVGSAALSGTSFTVNNVDSAGEFTITATGATTLNGSVQATNIALSGTNVVTNGMTASGNLSVNATGDITQLGETISVAGNTTLTAGDDLIQQGGTLTTTGTLTVTADQLDLSDFSVVGLASLNASGNASLGHSGDLNLAANVSRGLTLTNNGDVNIVGSVGRDVDITAEAGGISSTQLTVGGSGRYEAQSLNLVTDSAGAIEFDIEDDVVISNLGSLEVQGNATNLTLTAGSGSVTDNGALIVTDAASITANGSLGGIQLNNNNQFGSINLQTSGAVTINETDGTVIDGVTASSFELDSQGGVTDSLNSSISVTGLTTITANGDIILGNDATQTVNLGAIELTGETISIQNDGAGLIEIIDLDADSLTLTTAGDIEGDIGAVITVDDDAVIQGQDVQLTNGNLNFGSLDLIANSAALDSQNVTRFTRLNVANDFFLNSVGTVQGDPGAQLSVGGTFVISSDDSVSLSGQFSGLDITAATVDLELGSTTNIENIEAVSLTVDAGDSALTVSDFGLQIEESVDLQAGSIVIASDSNSVGSLSATTVAGGNIDVSSSISSQGDILLGADTVRLGGSTPITLSTQGAQDSGLITVTASPNGNADGQLFINGEVTLDTAAIQTAPGADVTLLVNETGQGQIGTEVVDGVTTRLTINAKGGDVTVASLNDADTLIDSFRIESANLITLNDVFVDGNTVSISGTGNIDARGAISDSTGAVSLSSGEGSINLAENVTANDGLSLTADAGSLTTANLTSNNGLTISTGSDVTLGDEVTVSSGDLGITSISGAVTVNNLTASSGGLNLRTAGQVNLNGSASASGTVTLASTGSSINAVGSISSGGGLALSAATDVEVSQIDVSSGGANLVSGGNLKFNQNVNVAEGFSAFSRSGSFEQAQNTLINAGTDIVISTQGGMKIASLRGENNVTLAIRQTEVGDGGSVPSFERVNDPITFGDDDAVPDVATGTGSISFLAQVANVGSTDPEQNFVQRAGGGIYYGLVSGQFFSDDIGTSQILVNAPASASLASSIVTDTSGLGALAGSLFAADFADLTSSITQSLQGTDSASSNAGQTSASSSSRSTAASQQDDEDEVAEVDEAAFQNLKNYDENPQGILLPEDQQFAYDASGNLYFMMAVRSDSGLVQSVPFYKVDLSPGFGGLSATGISYNYLAPNNTGWITSAGDD